MTSEIGQRILPKQHASNFEAENFQFKTTDQDFKKKTSRGLFKGDAKKLVLLIFCLVTAMVMVLENNGKIRNVASVDEDTTRQQPNLQIEEAIISDRPSMEYQDLVKSFRSPPILKGPVRLSDLPAGTRDHFKDFNMLQHRGAHKYVKGGVSKTQVPKQGQPFMQYDNVHGWSRTWSRELVNGLMKADSNSEDISCEDYPGSAFQIKSALENLLKTVFGNDSENAAPVRVLVAGSISPWVEALVLNSSLKLHNGTVHVTDYNPVVVEDPRIKFISMDDLKSLPSNPSFDVIISFSSIEHDGLGRYGDPINPAGDIAAMAEYHSMLKDVGGYLVLGIPVVPNDEMSGYLVRNWHRIYSLSRLEKLWCGFDPIGERIDPQGMENNNGKRSIQQDWQYQPVFVLSKTKTNDCYQDLLKKE